MNLKTLFLFLGLFIVAIILLKLQVTPKSYTPSPQDPSTSAPVTSPAQKPQRQNEEASTSLQKPKAETASSRTSSAIRNWLEEHAPSMNSFSEDDQKTLARKIQELGPEDLEHLRQISLSGTASAHVRVLAVYLMGESQKGWTALSEFLSSKIDLKEDAPAHSVNETANGREKALRVMAIEQLIENSKSPQEARQKLSILIPKIIDPWLADFAKRRLAEIP